MDSDYSSPEEKSQKRFQKNVLTLAERIAVIQQAKNTPKPNILATLAEMFDCGRTQIANILAHQESLLKEWEQSPDPDVIRRRRYDFGIAIGKMVFEWVKRATARSIAITDDVLRTQAMLAQQLTGFEQFKASKRWVDRFKAKHQLYFVPVQFSAEHETNPLTMKDVAKYLYAKNEITPTVYQAIQVNAKNPHPMPIKLRKRRGRQPATECSTPKRFLPSDGDPQAANSSCEEVEIMPDILTPQNGDDSENDFYEDDDSNNDPSYGSPAPAKKSTPSPPKPSTSTSKAKVTPIVVTSAKESAGPKDVKSYKEALEYLGPLEDFVLMQENFRAIGLVTQLENMFKLALKAKKNG